MKRILIIILVLPILSFSQTSKINKWDLRTVRSYIDMRNNSDNPLLPEEGIYNYSTDDPRITSQYKFAIFYYPEEYVFKAHLIEARCVGCQNWRIGEVKLVLEESVMDGEYSFKWYQPGRRNKKGKLKKPHYVAVTGNAYEEYDHTQIVLEMRGGFKVQLLKQYPR